MAYCIVCKQEIPITIWDGHVKAEIERHGEGIYQRTRKRLEEEAGHIKPLTQTYFRF